MDALSKLSKWFKRHLSQEVKLMVRTGYLNEELARTKEGATFLLNMLEDKYRNEILAELKEVEKELEAEEAEARKNCR